MPSLFDTEGVTGLPQTTATGIYYEIESLSPIERWVPAQISTTVICRVPWDVAGAWVSDMVGSVKRVVSGGGAVSLQRVLPEYYPFHSKQYCLRVEQVDQGGDPNDGRSATDDPLMTWADPVSGWPQVQWTRWRVTLEVPSFRVEDDATAAAAGAEAELLRYVLRRYTAAAKEMQVPGGGFKIVDDVTPANRKQIGQSGFKVVPFGQARWEFIRWPVAAIPVDSLEGTIGKINAAVFDSVHYQYPAETLLLKGFDYTSKRYFDANGDRVADWTLDCEYNPNTWNTYLNRFGQPVAISSDGTSSGDKPYETADFSLLVQPE